MLFPVGFKTNVVVKISNDAVYARGAIPDDNRTGKVVQNFADETGIGEVSAARHDHRAHATTVAADLRKNKGP
jgi:hypothetical protein